MPDHSVLIDPREFNFQLYDVLQVQDLCGHERFNHTDVETFNAILNVAGRLAIDQFLPLAQVCDEEEVGFDGSKVTFPDGVKAALETYRDTGLLSAGAQFEEGGLQLPFTITLSCMALIQAANVSLSGFPFTTNGVANVISICGSQEQKQLYLPPLREGRWFGVMAMSEPNAGSSLGDLSASAVPVSDGSFRVYGTKMWISGAGNDLVENIVHLVLARIAGAPPGPAGISLFIIPRFRADDQGRPTVSNDVTVAGLNKKMGFHGVPNTVLNFGEKDDCHAYLVGEANKGLGYMFHLINEARLWVGMGATMLASTGYRQALEYARTRAQGRKAGSKQPGSPQIPIIEHADIRRLLMTQKAYVEGALSLILYCGRLIDEEKIAGDEERDDDRKAISRRLQVLTPIVKSWPAEFCLESNKHAIQVLGGYGYARDFPLERLYRDNRLNAIHEGTHGIQAIDLLSRKVPLEGGKPFRSLLQDMRATAAGQSDPILGVHGETLIGWLARFETVTAFLRQTIEGGAIELGLANAALYLDVMGHLLIAWRWLVQADVAQARKASGEIDDDFGTGKLMTCRFFFQRELPKIGPLLDILAALEDTPYQMPDRAF